MKGKLRLRQISKLRVTEAEENQKEVQRSSKLIETGKGEQQYFELQIYDVFLKQALLPTLFGSLNTEIKEVTIRQDTPVLFNPPLNKQVIKLTQIPATGLIPLPKETLKFADIKLSAAKVEQLSPSLDTDIAKSIQIIQISRKVYKSFIAKSIQIIRISRKVYKSLIQNIEKGIQMDKTKTESFVPSFDIELESNTLLKQNSDLDTEVVTTNTESGIETLASSEGQAQLPIFEEFINCDKRFPRSFSESFNSPFVVLIGEDEYEWHVPIIYALKELFCEITDKHPRVTFREPELFEEGVEEIVDSLDLHSLDQFTFEYKIEFLDARKMHLAVDEFVKIVRGRLESGFLQQFGILVIAVRSKDLEKAKNALRFEGLRVYTCLPDNAKYEMFCSKILGVSSLNEFFANLRIYERYLDYTHRRFSIFVKRSADATDKLQYPSKVATFVYLLNDLRNRRKKIINNFEELCEFAKEILDKEIKIEAPILEGKVIPDLIYSPEGEEIYVEIETLIGALEPLKKIDETIEKYKDIPNATIWIVLKPVSAMIHYEELKARKKAYKILYDDKKIDFKVLTLLTSKGKFKWDLVNIDEFVRGKDVK